MKISATQDGFKETWTRTKAAWGITNTEKKTTKLQKEVKELKEQLQMMKTTGKQVEKETTPRLSDNNHEITKVLQEILAAQA